MGLAANPAPIFNVHVLPQKWFKQQSAIGFQQISTSKVQFGRRNLLYISNGEANNNVSTC